MQMRWHNKTRDASNLQDLGLLNEVTLLTRQSLEQLKKRAVRFKAWFKLDRLERAVIDLTIKVVERVRNSTLAQVILRIVNKLRQWIKPTLKERAITIGRPLAIKISCIAQAWGNHKARAWAEDQNFSFYLGLSWLNTSRIYRYAP